LFVRFFDGVHIRFCGYGRYWFRPYGGSLGKAPSNQALLPLTFGASPRLGIPSLRSCSVGPPPSAIHGRGRLTRHPCRVAHCAEPPLGLTRGRTPQQHPRRPTGRPGCWLSSLQNFDRPTGRHREQARSHRRAEQKQGRVPPRSSPLIRPSVSSPAAFDLDPPAPSAG
jgi:hypothetical protein